MRSSPHPDRRDFLTALGAGSVGGLTWSTFPFHPPDEHRRPAGAHHAQDADYLFEPGLIYLQTASLGPCPRQVVDATMQAWYALETNPTPMAYGEGATLVAAEHTRDRAAAFLGCNTEEIAITRSTTDGMNAIAQGLRLEAGQRVLTSDQEHDGGVSCWEYAARHREIAIDVVPIPPTEHDAGAIVDRFAAAITSETRVISVSHVLSSTGLRMPIAEISDLARSRGILCVVDGAQSAGGIGVDVKALGCHAYATSGHKWLLGPKGTGLLYLADEVGSQIEPMQFHGGREYYSHSSGVGNLPGVIGLGAALELLDATGMATIERHNRALRDRLYEGLMQIPAVTVASAPPGPLTSSMITFALPDRYNSGEFMLRLRERHRMIVKTVPKHWLNGIRLSTHIFNTEQEVDAVLRVLRTELA